jgi:uncharacterized protein
MHWEQLLFAHWPVPAAPLKALLQPDLELDTFDGQAWIGVVPFRMTNVAPRFTPGIPGLSRFLELNVRTYVRYQGQPGVWFFSLDATSWLSVRGARMTYYLPYFDAKIESERRGETVHYRSERDDWRSGAARLDMTYRPTGPAGRSAPGSHAHWLTERYRLYAQTPGGRLVTAAIEHEPWPLQPAEAEFSVLEMTEWMGVRLPEVAPVLHYSESIGVRCGRPVLLP